MQSILEEKMKFYESLFDVDNFRKLQINYFDDKKKFRQFIFSLRKEESLPEYAVGMFDSGMINAYIPTNIDIDSLKYTKTKCMPTHELFHIMYHELILNKYNLQRIIWFDEGMAQLFSGENDGILMIQESFNVWLDKLIENTKEFPNLNNLTHGTSFENEKYSGYKLSLLAVKYLYDSLNEDEFKLLMNNTEKIKSYGENVIGNSIKYYKNNEQIRRR